MALKEDQWLLGIWQLELEEIWMKVEFGVWTLEKGVEEMKKLPKLKQTELKKIQYKSSYEQWEVEQERVTEEQRKKVVGSGSG